MKRWLFVLFVYLFFGAMCVASTRWDPDCQRRCYDEYLFYLNICYSTACEEEARDMLNECLHNCRVEGDDTIDG